VEEETGNENGINCFVYPNPFNSNVNIIFNVSELNEDDYYKFSIHSITGEEVFSNRARLNLGENRLKWIPNNNLASGIYFARIQTPNKIFLSKVLYLK
jgi:hypothetical protein